MQYKQFPFAGCTIAFLGFTEEEEDHMKDIAAETGEREWRGRVVMWGLFGSLDLNSPDLWHTVCLRAAAVTHYYGMSVITYSVYIVYCLYTCTYVCISVCVYVCEITE